MVAWVKIASAFIFDNSKRSLERNSAIRYMINALQVTLCCITVAEPPSGVICLCGELGLARASVRVLFRINILSKLFLCPAPDSLHHCQSLQLYYRWMCCFTARSGLSYVHSNRENGVSFEHFPTCIASQSRLGNEVVWLESHQLN